MKAVSGLLENLDYQIIKGKPEGEITALVYDSRKVTKDCMFVCIRGAAYDSHEHVEEITEKGPRSSRIPAMRCLFCRRHILITLQRS